MRLNPSNSSLFALSLLFVLSSSLPFFPRKALDVEYLVPRATYSVVAVDGGAAATSAESSPQAASTIIETVVETQAPATKTVVEIHTLPPVTDVAISTQTIEAPETTHIVLVSVTESPVTVTATGYSIIDVSSPTVTIEVPEPISTESSLGSSTSSAPEYSSGSLKPTSSAPSLTSPCSTSGSAASTTAISAPSTSSIIYSNTSTSTSASSTSYTLWISSSSGSSTSSTPSYTSTFTTPAIATSTSSSVPTSSPSSASYDDGQWHTTASSWSKSLAAAAPTTVQAMPTLESNSPVDTIPDTVPGIE